MSKIEGLEQVGVSKFPFPVNAVARHHKNKRSFLQKNDNCSKFNLAITHEPKASKTDNEQYSICFGFVDEDGTKKNRMLMSGDFLVVMKENEVATSVMDTPFKIVDGVLGIYGLND
jgi:hypothetical protein